MPSPFPGMDPYLEEYWGDIHASLIIYARDEIQAQLPGNLRARVEERVFVDAPEAGERSVYPDLRVVERGHGRNTAQAPIGVVTTEPLIVDLDDDPITETYIEIIDIGSGRRVVTLIEVLSPANKRPGVGQELYRKKQQEMLAGKVNLVEIDLVRFGQSVLAVDITRVQARRHSTYHVVARRSWQPTKGEVYPIHMRERLPTIRVPLRETDEDVRLDLQGLIDRCYDNGGYQNDVNYEIDPDPKLSSEDAEWADTLLREQGRRKHPVLKLSPKRPKKRK